MSGLTNAQSNARQECISSVVVSCVEGCHGLLLTLHLLHSLLLCHCHMLLLLPLLRLLLLLLLLWQVINFAACMPQKLLG
jgi:hypothetical protein